MALEGAFNEAADSPTILIPLPGPILHLGHPPTPSSAPSPPPPQKKYHCLLTNSLLRALLKSCLQCCGLMVLSQCQLPGQHSNHQGFPGLGLEVGPKAVSVPKPG